MNVHDIKEGMKLVLKYPENGYVFDNCQAEEVIKARGFEPVLTVKSVKINNWSTDIVFNEVKGTWNSVQFEIV